MGRNARSSFNSIHDDRPQAAYESKGSDGRDLTARAFSPRIGPPRRSLVRSRYLFLYPQAPQRAAAELGRQLAPYRPTTICGPLTGGAFLAQLVAIALDARFAYTEHAAREEGPGLYAARYTLPPGLRASVRGERVAIVDDIINAGSAVRASVVARTAAGAQIVAFGALLTLGQAGVGYAASRDLPLVALDRQERQPLVAGRLPALRRRGAAGNVRPGGVADVPDGASLICGDTNRRQRSRYTSVVQSGKLPARVGGERLVNRGLIIIRSRRGKESWPAANRRTRDAHSPKLRYYEWRRNAAN